MLGIMNNGEGTCAAGFSSINKTSAWPSLWDTVLGIGRIGLIATQTVLPLHLSCLLTLNLCTTLLDFIRTVSSKSKLPYIIEVLLFKSLISQALYKSHSALYSPIQGCSTVNQNLNTIYILWLALCKTYKNNRSRAKSVFVVLKSELKSTLGLQPNQSALKETNY